MASGDASRIEPEAALDVFDRRDGAVPLTAREVADELDCARRTAYDKLETLAEQGHLRTKKVGARGRVWWRPVDGERARSFESTTELVQAQFEELADQVDDYAIFVLDPDGHVRSWNQGAAQIKGFAEQEILGEHFSTFYTDADREDNVPERNLARAREHGRTEDEGERVRADGSTFWANVTITALTDDGGDLRGFMKVTRDMTDRHQYEEQLRAQRDELSELNRINAVIRDIDQALVAASDRESIERAVCERLAGSETYAAAWIGEYAEDYEEVTSRSWAGLSEEFVGAIQSAPATDAMDSERSVGATALRTRTVRAIQNLADDATGEPWRPESVAEGYASAIAVPLLYDEVEYGVLTVYAAEADAFDERKIAVLGELGETISHAIAATRRKERERTLTGLQESTRELLHAKSQTEVGDVIVETLTEGLSLADAIVYHFDTTENTLELVSSSFQGEAHRGQLASLTAGEDSPLWASFVEGESRIADSVVPGRGMEPTRSLVVPLGEHGVLAVATEGERLERDGRDLVELVAATAEAAFDRLERRANLRERDELLQEQNQRLQRLNQINTIIRGVDQGLVEASTRQEIQDVVCQRLTDSDRFRFAWIGHPEGSDGELSPQAWSGEGRGYLDTVEVGAGNGSEEVEPAIAAARSDQVIVVSNVAGDLRQGQWRRAAFSREFQSVIAVPLRYEEISYGVLAVYADRPGVFDTMEQTVFAELGQTIANAMNAIETRQRLLTDMVVDLEFALHDESASFLSRLATQADCDIAYDGVIPLTEEAARLFFTAHGAPLEPVEDVLERSVGVESHRILSSGDDTHSIETVISGPTVPAMLVEYGASLQNLTVTDGEVRVVVDLPASADVRSFIEQFQHQYESAEFVARRERERPIQSRDGFRGKLEETLTERQLEVLKTAYLSGFFASPRRSSGRDVADVLGVSQPTVTEHLRTAQAKLLSLLFEEKR